jgi:hypothetical protein
VVRQVPEVQLSGLLGVPTASAFSGLAEAGGAARGLGWPLSLEILKVCELAGAVLSEEPASAARSRSTFNTFRFRLISSGSQKPAALAESQPHGQGAAPVGSHRALAVAGAVGCSGERGGGEAAHNAWCSCHVARHLPVDVPAQPAELLLR